jgi:hypothetical protein
MKTLHRLPLSALSVLALLSGYGFRRVSAKAQPGAAYLSEQKKLPPDILPDTFSRAARVNRDDLTSDAERQAFDRIYPTTPKPGVIKWLGPTGTRMLLPELAETYQTQLKLIRARGELDPKTLELATAVALRETNNKQEWINHQQDREKLLGPKIEDILKNNLPTTGLDEKDAVIIQYNRELFREPRVSSMTFAKIEEIYGKKKVLTMTLMSCYYAANGLLMQAYDQHMDTRPDCEGEHNGCLSAKNMADSW